MIDTPGAGKSSPSDIPDFAELNTTALIAELQERNAHLNARNSILDGQVKEIQKQRGSHRDLIAQVVTAVKAIEPAPKVKYERKTKSTTPVSAVLMLSDLHVGEVILPEETEEFGEYNWRLAQSRMSTLITKILDWTEMHRKHFLIDELHVLGIGDYISGNIHQELLVTNEFPLPVQTANAGYLIGDALSRLAPHYKKIVFVGQGADNHSRLQPKPQAKQKNSNSMSYLVHAIAQASIAKHNNVEFIRATGMKHLHEIAKHRFLIEHGDNVKAVMSIPFYGMQRVRAREAVRRMGTDKEFHYWAIGHWHVPSILEGTTLVNGSLSGTTEYDHASGRHALPSQVSFMMHPSHGFFDWTAWKLA